MQFTLKQKLIAANLSAVIIMAAALTWLSAKQLLQQTRSGIQTRATTLAKSASDRISDWIMVRKGIASAFSDYTDEKNIVLFLQQSRKAGDFDDIFFGTKNGSMYRSHPERHRDDYDPRSRPWYKDANLQGKQIITTAYQDAITGLPLITIAEPVYKNGNFVGVIGADLLIEKLIDDVINLDAGKNSHTILIDSKNSTFLAHPSKKYTLKPIETLLNQFSISNINKTIDKNSLESIIIDGTEKLFYFTQVPKTDWVFAIQMDKKTEEENHSILLHEMIITAISITAFVIFSVYWLIGFLFRDLGKVSKALEKITDGEGDLRQRLEIYSNDEVGKLAKNFNRFVGNMHKMITTLSRISSSLSEQANHTSKQADARSLRISHQQKEIEMVVNSVNEMAAATQEIASSAENTAHNSGKAVSDCVDGSNQVIQTQSSIQNLAKEVQIATTVIQKLEEHGNSINTILSTIQGIAEQTNLLALNAAIEAARAGEQGRGFAVVADEVRVLSQRTHASTKEIQDTIEKLQETTTQAVSIMNDSLKLSSTSVNDANSASLSLKQIQGAVERISDMATQIASSAEEQAAVTNEITRNTKGISEVSNQFSKEAKDTAKQASQLSKLSNELEKEISSFKL
ncbi:methyl-accepting chemotaxis protein [Candidatus Photodesmus anomalopis]|uniref:Methyl-accepting chemotaxis protein n=1 Tax=Candidatus Photodesmus katoptron Akat1 TaxID=1236703 RepID=S3DZ22_9GAMM|nr:methyl-accepting chemotaxis protein [Candidatus Photodesmus katoptron]EPE37181.1 methyl-accepting chemotaxis protein [Candidatus Photodesmus katoptron Akat1]